MQEHPPAKPNSWNRLWGGFAASLLVVGGGGIGYSIHWAMNHLTAPDVAAPNPVQTLPVSPQDQGLAIYWLQVRDNRIELAPVPATLDRSQSTEEIIGGAIRRLLAGPTEKEDTTTIPKGTQLLSIRVSANGIYLNLSQEFTSGGGTTSMIGRLAQVLYTATSLNPSEPVWLSVEGKPLEVLGGEGIMVDQPLTRKAAASWFPL